jgi:phosphate transport system substrate-binding protein
VLNCLLTEITVVHRADGSGTTFIFTDYLNEISPEWASRVGKGAAVKWPAPSSVGGKGNEGVAANVTRVKGAIGYVEYAYAKKNRIAHVKLQNRDGQYVDPMTYNFCMRPHKPTGLVLRAWASVL